MQGVKCEKLTTAHLADLLTTMLVLLAIGKQLQQVNLDSCALITNQVLPEWRLV